MSHFLSDSQLQDNLFTAKSVQKIDQSAIAELNNNSLKLMNRAGMAA